MSGDVDSVQLRTRVGDHVMGHIAKPVTSLKRGLFVKHSCELIALSYIDEPIKSKIFIEIISLVILFF